VLLNQEHINNNVTLVTQSL